MVRFDPVYAGATLFGVWAIVMIGGFFSGVAEAIPIIFWLVNSTIGAAASFCITRTQSLVLGKSNFQRQNDKLDAAITKARQEKFQWERGSANFLAMEAQEQHLMDLKKHLKRSREEGRFSKVLRETNAVIDKELE